MFVVQEHHQTGKAAFIRYEKHDEALRAITEMKGKVLRADMPPVNLIFAMDAREFPKARIKAGDDR